MKIELHEILIKELVKDYKNDEEEGVTGFGGKLDIRPKYQREFIYKDAQRDAVIDTVRQNFPLNVMYWMKNHNGSYEVMDGQQRTVSICEYVAGYFAINNRFFHNLTKDEQEQILNYKLMIYFCEGTDSETLAWFRIINIAGERLTEQELRNAIYTGQWLTDAKLYFSKTGCVAYQIANKYLNGSSIRQEYLETAIRWISDDKIEKYMSEHQSAQNANELWLYFKKVIDWVQVIFPRYRREMKGIAWGALYNQFKDAALDANALETKINALMQDDDVTNKRGIYHYVLDGGERHLNIRAFTDNMKREAYERQKGVCPVCGGHFEIGDMEADHITPWHCGGKTTASNCQMLCKEDNRRKSGK